MPEPAPQIDTDRDAARETLRVALENLEATGNYSNGAYLAVHPAWKRQWSRPGWSRSHLVRAVEDFTGIEASTGESAQRECSRELCAKEVSALRARVLARSAIRDPRSTYEPAPRGDLSHCRGGR